MTDPVMHVPYSYLKDQFADPEPILKAFRDQLARCEFTFGPELTEFEKKMADYTGAKYCLGTSSGTMALSMLLRAVGVEPGDEVITVSQTFVATIGSIVTLYARPYFIDVTDDFTMDPAHIEKAITKKTKAIMPVHYSGQPAQMKHILEIADRHRIPVIEDACCAISAKIDGRHVGTFGTGGAFSVHPLKNLNVWGDGGFIITNSSAMYEQVLLLRNHGLKNRDEVDLFGYNARLDTIQAIVGNFLHPQIDDITDKRIANAKKYDDALSAPELSDFITLPPRRGNERHVYHMYMFLAEHRDRLLQYLIDRGIEAKVHYPIPMHLQKATLDQKTPYPHSDLSITEHQCKALITLPVHQHLSASHTGHVIDCIRKFYGDRLWK
ncbi:MAG TPA: DegT/DnrJ/EryC1/StrS family aminotransferase [Spirochaetota bacterium]|nr:DegT/DnrJ/EryC1/StrS family aminotransferase [Spirochaetota bacterium]HNT11650.1 DegT/DnrJ/EryC1/StrS family aminotransferase [Spirochaetota bacterium]